MDRESLPEPQQQAMDRWMEQRGFWSEVFNELLFVSPEYVEAYADLSSRPGSVLDEKTKELIHIAINSSTTHLYHRGTRTHIRNALRIGATVDEIVEVLILASTVGMHTSSTGASLLFDVFQEDVSDSACDELKQKLESQLGFWSEELDALFELDAPHLADYLDLLSIVKDSGVLSSKTQNFVLLAVEIAPTRSNSEAARHHISNARDAGATMAELMAVIETSSVIGVHTMDAMPILIEEAARVGKLPESFEGYEEFVTFRDPYR